MGALTLKSFPFELRGWDIEKFESVDPTDGFGISTRVYISKQQIVQIEPDHSENTSNAWLSDKGRQFFDGIFGAWKSKNEHNKELILKKEYWQQNLKTLLKTLYLFEHCSAKTKKNRFLTVVFENLGIETLSLLKIMEQKYSFLKLRRAENLKLPNDLEFNFQLNTATNPNKLKSSTLCLLIANNSRYEGYRLNLNLRQRYLKGNFKCLLLGSSANLTFPSTVIGTNLKVLKEIAEGNNFACQDFKTAKNPLLIFGNEFYKRTDSKNATEMFKILQNASVFTPSWNGLNSLSSTLTEVGTQSIGNFVPLNKKDFTEFSSFYFINVSAHNVPSLKKITETKLLNYANPNGEDQFNRNKLFLDQNSNFKNNQIFAQSALTQENNYSFLPVKMFYENKETFLNTEGFIKRTHKLITRRKTREGWKLLRNLLSTFKHKYTSLSSQNNNLLSFNTTKQISFSNFLNFHYCAVEKLESSTSSLATQNQPFYIYQTNMKFRQKVSKITQTKTKYWIDDFFTGGKDEYSRNSLVLANCSKILRTQSTNFF